MQIPIFNHQVDSERVSEQCTWQANLNATYCYQVVLPPKPRIATAQDQMIDFANAYWIYGLLLLLWMGFCLILRTGGRTDLTVNHYETYEGYEINDPSEDDDE